MWKVCQLLKGGRSHLSRSCNANSLHSPIQPSPSSTPNLHTDSNEKRKCRPRRPIAFTPSAFRAMLYQQQQNQHQNDDQNGAFIRLFSLDEGDPVKEESSSDDDNFGGGRDQGYRRRRRPDRDHDGWRCRCRCSFGDWLGYTTMVAATIHLSRVTVHLLPNNKEKQEIRKTTNDENSTRSSPLIYFKDAVQSGWHRFLIHAAPVLFPDLFKQWYVLPTIRPALSTSSASRGQFFNAENIQEQSPLHENSSIPSSTSSPASTSRSTSDDCGVQTDPVGVGTPFDELVWDGGHRLAVFSRLTDVGLEHAIGVDMLKRRLYDEAIDYVLGAARSGHPSALYNLGICYSRGYGVGRDMLKAVEMWRSAADQGHGLSKYQLGACHARGIGGLAIDFDRALRYMHGAAAAGVPEAKTYLAAHEYKEGRLDGALELLRQAMGAGDKNAAELLSSWPAANESSHHRHDVTQNGYGTNITSELGKMKTAAITRVSNGRSRFWATSSEENSLSSSSSYGNEAKKGIEIESASNSSVVFCNDESTASNSESIDHATATTTARKTRILETVASVLKLGGLRRSRTAPEIHYSDMLVEPAIAAYNVEGVGV